MNARYFVGQFVTLHKCFLRFMGHNVFYAKEKVEHYPLLQYTGPPPTAYSASKVSNVFHGWQGRGAYRCTQNPPQLACSITCQST